jgi:polyphosphate kinase
MVFHPDRVPCTRPTLQNRLKQILETQLADDVKGWLMQSDGDYHVQALRVLLDSDPKKMLYELLVDG